MWKKESNIWWLLVSCVFCNCEILLFVVRTLCNDLFPPINVVKTAFWEFGLMVSGEFNPSVLIEIVEMFGSSLPFYFVSYFNISVTWLSIVFSLSFSFWYFGKNQTYCSSFRGFPFLSVCSYSGCIFFHSSPLPFLHFPTWTSPPGIMMWDLFQINLCYLGECVCVCFNSTCSYLDNYKF